METTYINIAEKQRLYVEEKSTLVFLVVSFFICSFFGVNFFRNFSEYLYFFFGMLIPAFLGTTLVGWLVFRTSNPFTRANTALVIRVMITLFVGFYAYSHLKVIAPLVNHANYDELFLKLDRLLFLGLSPTLELLKIKSALFNGLMYYSYTSFYAAFPLSFAAAFLARNATEMRRLVFGILVIYFFGVIFYYLFPAWGPLFTTPELFSHIPNIWQKVLWDGHLSITSNPTGYIPTPYLGVAAFPSLHGAHALFLVLIAYRYHKRLFYIYIPWLILLYISTIFMGWHYVMDLIAGALISIAAIKITYRLVAIPE